jgi:hypothetical protein
MEPVPVFRDKKNKLVTEAELGEFTELSGAAIEGNNRVVDFFYRYWRNKKRDGHLPCRADIQPMEISQYIDHTVIMDVTGSLPDFQLSVRLIGTHVTAFYGEITGKDVGEMSNQNAAERIYHICSKVLASGEPQLTVTPAFSPDRQYMEAYALYMPLFGENHTIDKILVAVDVRSLFR